MRQDVLRHCLRAYRRLAPSWLQGGQARASAASTTTGGQRHPGGSRPACAPLAPACRTRFDTPSIGTHAPDRAAPRAWPRASVGGLIRAVQAGRLARTACATGGRRPSDPVGGHQPREVSPRSARAPAPPGAGLGHRGRRRPRSHRGTAPGPLPRLSRPRLSPREVALTQALDRPAGRQDEATLLAAGFLARLHRSHPVGLPVRPAGLGRGGSRRSVCPCSRRAGRTCRSTPPTLSSSAGPRALSVGASRCCPASTPTPSPRARSRGTRSRRCAARGSTRTAPAKA